MLAAENSVVTRNACTELDQPGFSSQQDGAEQLEGRKRRRCGWGCRLRCLQGMSCGAMWSFASLSLPYSARYWGTQSASHVVALRMSSNEQAVVLSRVCRRVRHAVCTYGSAGCAASAQGLPNGVLIVQLGVGRWSYGRCSGRPAPV